MVTIIDYGVGNLFSLESSFAFIGEEATVTSDPDAVRSAERLILPGVGAFGDAAEKLRSSGMFEAVLDAAEAGIPLLGICLGMQLLFEKSFEYGEHGGLGLIKGSVRPMRGYIPDAEKIPQIGWNSLALTERGGKCPIFEDIKNGDFVYFVHSFYGADCGGALAASTDCGGVPVTAAVWGGGSVFGTQFHPEKSGDVGLRILKSFSKVPKGGPVL
ncbi:MAG: imidazole glycerol phosphate synthase subunit HisH [Clostridia bacterium]|nr:imidazole glycerol phosphate synthase subunit HisH [Clostridia bacterium]MBR7032167.1 imidazole glycerol phosphate synthase subunit HisH [Clostridia bacterium]